MNYYDIVIGTVHYHRQLLFTNDFFLITTNVYVLLKISIKVLVKISIMLLKIIEFSIFKILNNWYFLRCSLRSLVFHTGSILFHNSHFMHKNKKY